MDQQDLITPPNYNAQQALPNATASLVLGIISIVGTLCYGIVGLVCGIIGLVLANKDKQLYESDPERYAASYSTSSAGRVCSIIGIVLSSLFLLFIIVYLIVVGSLISTFVHRS